MGSMAIYTLDEHSGGKKPFIYFFIDWMWSYFTYDPSLRLIIKPQPSKEETENKKATINKASLSRNPIIIETIFELARLSLKQRVYHGIRARLTILAIINYTPS